jgi:hypothetical protein
MAYDPEKDKLIKDLGNGAQLTLATYSYGGAAPKLRLTKITKGKTGNIYRDICVNVHRSDLEFLLSALGLTLPSTVFDQ